ncbi:hypothetical protein FACS1894217_12380 [Clostridia bacterium]|nr:hypothetical protein FACS1894217_12380 [Clostridia bacterium]
MIRRHIPKGTPIENYTVADIQRIEDWINDYPRQILGWKHSAQLFKQELEKLKLEGDEFLADTS